MRLPVWLLRALDWILPARSLSIVHGDTLPDKLPRRDILLLRDGGEDWYVGLRCPCGCGQRIELLRVETNGTPTLSPSVWLKDGCHSHFFVRKGKVLWV